MVAVEDLGPASREERRLRACGHQADVGRAIGLPVSEQHGNGIRVDRVANETSNRAASIRTLELELRRDTPRMRRPFPRAEQFMVAKEFSRTPENDAPVKMGYTKGP